MTVHSSRRAAVAAVAAVGAIAVGLREFRRLLAPPRKPTPYDDLLAKINDRDDAAELGKYVIASMPHFNAGSAADVVRARLKNKTLSELLVREASTGRMVEVGGWIVPESLALVCALAAGA